MSPRRRLVRDPHRRRFLAALAALSALPRSASAARTRRVGVLEFGEEGEFAPDFARAMASLGRVEGKDIAYDCRHASLDPARVAVLAAQMVRSRPEAIVAPGTAFTNALLRETTSIPIVTTAADPVGSGFARTLARPGRNVTGLALASPESALKAIELLKEIIPGPWKLGVLEEGPQSFMLRSYEEAARQNGIAVVKFSLKDKGEVDRAFASMRSQGIRIVLGARFPAGYDGETMPVLARSSGVSTISSEEGVARGVLLSYEARHRDANARLAMQLDKILRGMAAGDIPFELPTAFRVAINVGTARALGFTVPQGVLLRVDKVYG